MLTGTSLPLSSLITADSLKGRGLPDLTTAILPIERSNFDSFISAPLRPTAAMMRPQLGSAP
ncbi:hypothetical protein ES703_39214 [subsurface metagenome]